jgi:hypothetical protein
MAGEIVYDRVAISQTNDYILSNTCVDENFGDLRLARIMVIFQMVVSGHSVWHA